jgi:hypothetical protein
MPTDVDAEHPPRRRRDGLPIVTTVVQFFTSVTGLVTAMVTLLGAVAAIAIANVNPSAPPGGSPASATPVSPPGTSAPTRSPEPSPANNGGVEQDAWVRDVNQACQQAGIRGVLGALETGDMSGAAGAFGALAEALRSSSVPAGFEDEAASAADDLGAAASAASVNDVDAATSHANAASETLNSVGVTDC